MSTTIDSRDFIVYLLSTMRATELVATALRELRVDARQVTLSRSRVVAGQFENIGHPMTLYEPLFGLPYSSNNVFVTDPNKARAARYRLRPWPELDFVVFGTIDGLTTSWRFERPQGATPVAFGSVAGWAPWQIVESDLATAWNGEVKVTEEWYPQRDLLLAEDKASAIVAVQFDYGLLQRVEVLGPDF